MTTLPPPTTAATATTDEEPDMRIDTVQDLLAAIARLPHADREVARRRVEEAIACPALEARAALGLLALDVAGLLDARSARVIRLPEFARPAAASA